MSQLDMTHSTNTGQELITEVNKIVGDSQAYILTPLPDEILLTEQQYLSLSDYDDVMMAMADYSMFTDQITEQSKNKLFYTPHNVMEVRVKGYTNA